MSKQQDYMPPIVESALKFGKKKFLISAWEILLHGVLPHARAKGPSKTFNSDNLKDEDDFLFLTANDFYKETSERIEFLEEKGFKLMTIYLLSTDPGGLYKWSIIISLIPLTLALLISLRCIGVKSQKALYIDSLFEFKETEDSTPKNKSKKDITAALINCGVFNQNVADSTADLIKATRLMLSLGIILTLLSCCLYLATGDNKKKESQNSVLISFPDSTFVPSVKSHLKTIDSILLNGHLPTNEPNTKQSPDSSIHSPIPHP